MKIKILILFFCFLSLFNFILGLEVEEDAYISALEIYNKNDFKNSKKLFEEFLEKFSASKYKPKILLKLGQLENDFDKAISIYDNVINNYSDSENEIEAIYLKGVLFFTKEKYKESKNEFQKIIEKFSESIWTEPSYYYLLLNNYALKNYDEAEKIYKKYIDIKNFYVYKNRMDLCYANVLYSKGKYPEAIELYKEVLNKTNTDDKNIFLPYIYRQIIECYKKQNDIENATKYEKELNEKFPKANELLQEHVLPEKSETPVLIKKDESNASEFFTIQIGAYTNKKFADIMYKKLLEKKYTVFLKTEGKFYKIQVGKFVTKQEADDYAKDLMVKEKLKSYLVKKFE